MSTEYYCYCTRCKKCDGANISRKSWGWANVDIINLMQFILKHIDECDGTFEFFDENIVYGDFGIETLNKFLNDNPQKPSGINVFGEKPLEYYYPYSNDWDAEGRDVKFTEHLEAAKTYKEKEKQWEEEFNANREEIEKKRQEDCRLYRAERKKGLAIEKERKSETND